MVKQQMSPGAYQCCGILKLLFVPYTASWTSTSLRTLQITNKTNLLISFIQNQILKIFEVYLNTRKRKCFCQINLPPFYWTPVNEVPHFQTLLHRRYACSFFLLLLYYRFPSRRRFRITDSLVADVFVLPIP